MLVYQNHAKSVAPASLEPVSIADWSIEKVREIYLQISFIIIFK